MGTNAAPISADTVAFIRERLLAHYDARRRDLPWRQTRDPYAVWVSEIMLQQTRVETVIPYYERWMRQFPSVDALAGADIDRVLKSWEGLGYYSRARNLHRAATIVRERYNGILPDSVDQLRELPGIGEYTAGAIASIAYARRAPAVDGNVKRVLARLLDEPAPAAKLLRKTAESLVPHDRAGDFNQALMELGATICVPAGPRCEQCPIARACRACHAGTQLERPARQPKRRIPEEYTITLVARRERELAVRRRPAKGLLAGLWEFPDLPLHGQKKPEELLRIACEAFGTDDVHALPPISHTFTHKRIHYHPFVAEVSPAWTFDGAVFHGLETLSQLAMAAAQQAIKRTVIAFLQTTTS